MSRQAWMTRVMLLVFSGLALLTGAVTLWRGSVFFRNYWGGEGFAPTAIIIGILCAVAAFRVK
jgi:hypothetical protein